MFACLLLASTALGWQGKFSSTTVSSTSRTYNPLQKVKQGLRNEIEAEINGWRSSKWSQLKQLLAREHFFRDFEGRMFGITLSQDTMRSQLWEVKHFTNVAAIGGGLGVVYGADSLAWDPARGKLRTLGVPAKSDSSSNLHLYEVDTFTGYASPECRVAVQYNQMDSRNTKFKVLDMAQDGARVLAHISLFATYPGPYGPAIYTIAINPSPNDEGECEAHFVAQEEVYVVPDLVDDESRYGVAVRAKAVGGPQQLFVFPESGTGKIVVESSEGWRRVAHALPSTHQSVNVHAAAFDDEYNALWLIGTSSKWNFLCGYLVESLEACTADGCPACAPEACFEIPALDGIEVAN